MNAGLRRAMEDEAQRMEEEAIALRRALARAKQQAPLRERVLAAVDGRRRVRDIVREVYPEASHSAWVMTWQALQRLADERKVQRVARGVYKRV